MKISFSPDFYQHYPNYYQEVHLYGTLAGNVPQGWYCNRHLHHLMIEFNLVLSGCQTAVVGGKTYKQRAGDLLIIPPMRLHDYQAEQAEPLQFFVFHLQLSDIRLTELLSQSPHGDLYEAGHPLNILAVPTIEKLLEKHRAGASQNALFAVLYELLSQLEDYWQVEAERNAMRPQQENELPRRIAREIEKLVLASDGPEGEDDGALSNWLEALSERLCISRRHCSRVFHQAYGHSPRAYLAVLRQQEAMHALLNSSDTVEQIAYRIRFENVQSFIRQFQKWTGFTPGAFRKSHKGQAIYLTPLEERPNSK